MVVFKKHMWNIIRHLQIHSGLGEPERVAGGKSAVRNKLPLCLPITCFFISLLAPQLPLFVYLIYWQALRRSRCSLLVPLFYSGPVVAKSAQKSCQRLSLYNIQAFYLTSCQFLLSFSPVLLRMLLTFHCLHNLFIAHEPRSFQVVPFNGDYYTVFW